MKSIKVLVGLVAALTATSMLSVPGSADTPGAPAGSPRRAAAVIELGNLHTCAIVAGGHVRCWGYNAFGQLGHDDQNNIGDGPGEMGSALDHVDLGAGREGRAVALGHQHTCALLDAGEVKCWGLGGSGQLGSGDIADLGDGINPGGGKEMGDALQAVDLGTGRTASAVAASSSRTCVLLDHGDVRCWGSNGQGSLGLGTADVARGDEPGEMGDLLPIVDLGTDREATAIAMGTNHTCVLLDAGDVKCWGRNTEGQLGLGAPGARGDGPDEMGDLLPAVDLGTGRSAVAISAGGSHTCALLDTGDVKCWGQNNVGQLGYDDQTTRGLAAVDMGDGLPAVDLGAGMSAVAISAGAQHTCAVLGTGDMKCWGWNANAQLGQGHLQDLGDGIDAAAVQVVEMGDALFRVPLVAGAEVLAMATGLHHTCVLLDDETVRCWGGGGNGTLGTGNPSRIGDSPGEVPPPPVDVGQLDGGIWPVVPIVDPPSAPAGVAATPGVGGASLTWTAPLDDGGASLSGYRIESSLDGVTWSVVVADTATTVKSAVAAGLAPGVPVRFRVSAINDEGAGAPSLESNPVMPLAPPVPPEPPTPPGPPTPPAPPLPDGDEYVGLVPARLLDTRRTNATVDGSFSGGGQVAAGSVTAVKLSGRGGVPADARAVTVNTTVVGGESAGYATLYPCDAPRPEASNLNFVAGADTANTTVTKTAADGTVCVYTSAAAQLLVDVFGYHPAGSAYQPLVPARLLDTRASGSTTDDLFAGAGSAGPGSVLSVQIAGRGGVPLGAGAAVVSLTATSPEADGYATMWPCDAPRPEASNLNYRAGRDRANSVVAKLAADGTVCVSTSAASHLLVDVAGFHPAATSYVPIVPARLLDTRSADSTIDGIDAGAGAAGAGSTIVLQIAGRAGVPAGTSTVVVDLTAVASEADGFATMWPCDAPRPDASNVNYPTSVDVANTAITKLASDGTVCLYTSASAHYVVDLQGRYP